MSQEQTLITSISALLASTTDRILVGIVGPPASGKTTLTNQLASTLGESSTQAISMDGYHHTNDHLMQCGLYPWKGCHFTFDAVSFVGAIKEMKEETGKVVFPSYDRTVHHDPVADQIEVFPKHRCVIVEGNYLLLDVAPWSDLITLWDYSIFIDVEEEIQINRLMQRHIQGGKTKQQAFEKVYSTDIPNSHLIRQSRQRADQTFILT